ncbi:3724_t:CDS:2 [Ambispora gerdemannii]|uniref:3724_t:CDS:1 n=1 Tax=Ambispora gerdemannii TaxID=144530 RepID=A0A9N9GY40_9GLOM|nr:3724_t:CDS:2 [Ambispora gerdemannii]
MNYNRDHISALYGPENCTRCSCGSIPDHVHDTSDKYCCGCSCGRTMAQEYARSQINTRSQTLCWCFLNALVAAHSHELLKFSKAKRFKSSSGIGDNKMWLA